MARGSYFGSDPGKGFFHSSDTLKGKYVRRLRLGPFFGTFAADRSLGEVMVFEFFFT